MSTPDSESEARGVLRMSGGRGKETEASRGEAARRAVRALASAYRTLRLYPLQHAKMTEALEGARGAIEAFAAAHGPLSVKPALQGVLIDLAASPYDDGVVADFARALRSHAIPSLRLLHGVTAEELGELLSILRQPRSHLERAGGALAALAARGLRSVSAGPEGPPTAPSAAQEDLAGPLLAALETGSVDQVRASLHQAGEDGDAVRALLRAVDGRLVTRPRASQAAAWRLVGQAMSSFRTPVQAALCGIVVRSLAEPWAASIASQWPPVLAASLAAPDPHADAQRRGRQVAEIVRSIHRSPDRVALPYAAPDPSAVSADAAATRWEGRRLRAHAVLRLGEMLPAMDGAELRGALGELEETVVSMAQEGDGPGLLAALAGLASAWDAMDAIRRSALHAPAHRAVILGGRTLLDAAAHAPEHPGTAAGLLIPILLGGELIDALPLRREAVRALGRLGTPESIAALRHVAAKAKGELLDEVRSALGRLGKGGA